MYPRANQSPQSISLTTKKRSAQGSMVPPHDFVWLPFRRFCLNFFCVQHRSIIFIHFFCVVFDGLIVPNSILDDFFLVKVEVSNFRPIQVHKIRFVCGYLFVNFLLIVYVASIELCKFCDHFWNHVNHLLFQQLPVAACTSRLSFSFVVIIHNRSLITYGWTNFLPSPCNSTISLFLCCFCGIFFCSLLDVFVQTSSLID